MESHNSDGSTSTRHFSIDYMRPTEWAAAAAGVISLDGGLLPSRINFWKAMRKFVPCKVETAAVVGHAGTVKNMTPKKKRKRNENQTVGPKGQTK